MLGKIEDRRRGHQKLRWLDSITDGMDMNLGKLKEMVRNREPWSSAVYGVTKSRTLPGNFNSLHFTSYSSKVMLKIIQARLQ